MMEEFKKHQVSPEEAYSQENLLNYSIKAKDPECIDLEHSMESEGIETYLFNSGWLVLRHDKVDKELDIANAYFNPKGAINRKKGWDNIIDYAKHLGCKKITICTDRSPKAYERKYGFKTVTRHMEKIL